MIRSLSLSLFEGERKLFDSICHREKLVARIRRAFAQLLRLEARGASSKLQLQFSWT